MATLLGFLRRKEAAKKGYELHAAHNGGWRIIHEPFAGAWQRNMEEKRGALFLYPTLYACINRIASDIGKLRFVLRRRVGGISEIMDLAEGYAINALRRPNQYQTEGQFRELWIISKLLHGNAYILCARDAFGRVAQMHVLHPMRVLPMVTDSGEVVYKLRRDELSRTHDIVVPASEIIHDRINTLWHPLIGVPPIAAANFPALKNLKILRNATNFFGNNQQPGGLLTAPAGMSQADFDRVKEYWEENYSGDNTGKVAVIGADMKFTTFAMKSIDSQMIEQTRYSDEQICQPFGIPPFKVGIGSIPAGLGVDGLNQLYYADALQAHIEHMEMLLTDYLDLDAGVSVCLDIDALIRMDESKRAEVETKLVAGKIKTPDEGRARFDLPPTGGGDTLWGQHQDYPLGVLAARSLAEEAANDSEESVDDTAKAVASFRSVFNGI